MKILFLTSFSFVVLSCAQIKQENANSDSQVANAGETYSADINKLDLDSEKGASLKEFFKANSEKHADIRNLSDDEKRGIKKSLFQALIAAGIPYGWQRLGGQSIELNYQNAEKVSVLYGKYLVLTSDQISQNLVLNIENLEYRYLPKTSFQKNQDGYGMAVKDEWSPIFIVKTQQIEIYFGSEKLTLLQNMSSTTAKFLGKFSTESGSEYIVGVSLSGAITSLEKVNK